MNFGKKIVIALDLKDTSDEQLELLRSIELVRGSELHFVYVHQTTFAVYGLGECAQVYPATESRESIAQAAVSVMVGLCEPVAAKASTATYRCLFDENPKEEFCLYAKEVKADTIIVLSRARHGFFESSFGSYVARHSPCHLIVLKPSKEKP